MVASRAVAGSGSGASPGASILSVRTMTTPVFWNALDMIGGGYFSVQAADYFRPLVDSLTRDGDHYLLLADYASYIACQERVDALYRDVAAWSRCAIRNVAAMGMFSSDRAILEYARAALSPSGA